LTLCWLPCFYGCALRSRLLQPDWLTSPEIKAVL
jgi:hypothetical protein